MGFLAITNHPMRILHIMAGKGQGGAETYSTDVMLGLRERGVDQCVVMHRRAPRYGEIVAAGIRTAPEVLDMPFTPWRRFMLGRLLRREKPDIVHCWMRRAASIMPRWDACPVIGWFGGYYDPKHFGRCGHFVGVTRDIVAHMARNGVPQDRAHFIPTFPDVRDEPPISRAAFDTPDDAFVLLALSRLHPKKGLDTLLRAAANLPQAYVWLAGEGPLRGELEALTAELGLQNRVRFLGWRTDRGALLRSCDVCVLPSRYEPFGTVILEAWAAGVPFVACRSAGPSATVKDGVDGLLADIDDVPALTEALRRLRDDPRLRASLAENGRAAYLRDYTRDAVLDKMSSLYDAILSGHSAASGGAASWPIG